MRRDGEQPAVGSRERPGVDVAELRAPRRERPQRAVVEPGEPRPRRRPLEPDRPLRLSRRRGEAQRATRTTGRREERRRGDTERERTREQAPHAPPTPLEAWKVPRLLDATPQRDQVGEVASEASSRGLPPSNGTTSMRCAVSRPPTSTSTAEPSRATHTELTLASARSNASSNRPSRSVPPKPRTSVPRTTR